MARRAATAASSGWSPFSKRTDASLRRPRLVLVARTLTGSKFADSRRITVVASVTSAASPPMRPGDGHGLVRVGDDKHLGRQCAVDAVEGAEALVPAGRAGR